MKRPSPMYALASLAIAAAVLLAPPIPAAAQSGTPVKLTLMSQPNEAGFPLWLATKLGYFSGNGLDVKIQYFPTAARRSPRARQATGRADGSARHRRSPAGRSSG